MKLKERANLNHIVPRRKITSLPHQEQDLRYSNVEEAYLDKNGNLDPKKHPYRSAKIRNIVLKPIQHKYSTSERKINFDHIHKN